MDTNGSVKAKWSLGSALFVENVSSTFRRSSNGIRAAEPSKLGSWNPICVHLLLIEVKKLKYSFDKEAVTTVEYHNKNKGFNALIDERRVCGEYWKIVY